MENNNKMEKGKWYEIEVSHSPYTCLNIVKAVSHEGHSFHAETGFFCVRDCNGKKEGWDISSPNPSFGSVLNWKEISIEEVQKYLPDNHPDKKIEKWAVGTYVVCIKDYTRYFNRGDVAQLEKGAYVIDGDCVNISKGVGGPCMPYKTYCEWFATLSEAEAFAKTISNLPKKWRIQITSNNQKDIEEFLHTNCTDYIGYDSKWRTAEDCWFYYPQPHKGMHSSQMHHTEYNHEIISTEQFLKIKESMKPNTKKWCIKVTPLTQREVKAAFDILCQNTMVFDSTSFYYYINHLDQVCMFARIPSDYEEINITQLKSITNAKTKTTMATTIVGYKLKKAYPGSESVGYTTSNTTVLSGMRLANYPEFWEPIYQQYDDLKVGDFVTITTNSKTPNCNGNMVALNGKTVKINKITKSDGFRSNVIKFDEDGGWCWAQSDTHFRVATAAEIRAVSTKILPFGPLTFTIEGRVASCSHGKITKSEVKAVLDWLDTPIRLLGYGMELATSEEPKLKFGCTTGTIAEARAILAAFN